jgi:uncharacterized SAM-binding protein YcdF (DUF218 family)
MNFLRARRAPSDQERGGIFFRLIFVLFLVCLCVGVYFLRYPLLRFAGNFWVVDQTPDSADVIVMLSDDNYFADRANRAAELYKAGHAQHIVASGVYLRPYATISELEQHDLTDRGVPATAIVRFPHHAHNTREECMALNPLLVSHAWKRVLLVTSNYHTRRSQYICEREFPQGTFLHVIAAPDSDYSPDSWWKSRESMKIFFHEAVGMAGALWEERDNDVHTTGSSWFGLP